MYEGKAYTYREHVDLKKSLFIKQKSIKRSFPLSIFVCNKTEFTRYN